MRIIALSQHHLCETRFSDDTYKRVMRPVSERCRAADVSEEGKPWDRDRHKTGSLPDFSSQSVYQTPSSYLSLFFRDLSYPQRLPLLSPPPPPRSISSLISFCVSPVFHPLRLSPYQHCRQRLTLPTFLCSIIFCFTQKTQRRTLFI